ncbi:MAG: hypothetical protein BGN83_09220 [Rhizobium sp. 63-7]|nr:MAG: hypothetical protein BGN83_09220 [Rhizobium sp. 63-7]
MTKAALSIAPETTQPASAPSRGHVRAMRRSDIPAVHALFAQAFRKDAEADFVCYIEALFFDNPNYSEADGSLVYENGNGAVNSVILALPMPFSVHGRRVMGRLICAFMSDRTPSGSLGAAHLILSIRASQVDLCFTDNAAPVSADHCLASGGSILSPESLEWRRVFRPFRASVLSPETKVPALFRPGVARALGLADRMLLRWKPSTLPPAPPGCTTKDAPLPAFLECAEAMTERFPVRPIWSKDDFDWLTRMAGANRRLGQLQCRTVEAKGRTIGAFLFFANPRNVATVLNVVCEEGREGEVVGQMFASLSQDHAAATGMTSAHIMNALMRQRQLTFRHRGYFCISSRHEDLMNTARAGQIYIGGLASERWSKLVTGF